MRCDGDAIGRRGFSNGREQRGAAAIKPFFFFSLLRSGQRSTGVCRRGRGKKFKKTKRKKVHRFTGTFTGKRVYSNHQRLAPRKQQRRRRLLTTTTVDTQHGYYDINHCCCEVGISNHLRMKTPCVRAAVNTVNSVTIV